MCLSNIIEIGRETKDIDFLVRNVRSDRDEFKKIFSEIAEISVDDGFIFKDITISDIAVEKKYPSFRTEIQYNFGNSRGKIQIDTGIGDIVEPKLLSLKMLKTAKGTIFEDNLEVLAYTPEFIFSEKLHTAVKLGAANSRAKDYHDMFMLIQAELFDNEALKKAITATFRNRETAVTLIPAFTGPEIKTLQQYWKAHHSNISDTVKETIPAKIITVIEFINNFLKEQSLI